MNASINDYIIIYNQFLKDALIKMTSVHRGVLLVLDEKNHLFGLLSDGDIRRALLKEVSLRTTIDKIMNINPIVAKDATEAKSLLQKRKEFLIIPIVDESNNLLAIYDDRLDSLIINDQIQVDEVVEQKEQIETLAIIPARGGSKRIPNKNLYKIGDESLLSLAIKCAQESQSIEHIIVSTDSQKIANEAQNKGAHVPWLRPHSLAEDNSKTFDVLVHAVEAFKDNHGYLPKYVVLLEPTAPLRTPQLVEKAIQKLKSNTTADSLVSVNKVRHNFHPEELLVVKEGQYLDTYLEHTSFDNRKYGEEQIDVFVQNGLIYVSKTETLLQKNSIYGDIVLKFQTDEDLFCDIDTFDDILILKAKLTDHDIA